MCKDALVFQYQFERGTSFCVSFAGGANFNSYKMDKNAESAKMLTVQPRLINRWY